MSRLQLLTPGLQVPKGTISRYMFTGSGFPPILEGPILPTTSIGSLTGDPNVSNSQPWWSYLLGAGVGVLNQWLTTRGQPAGSIPLPGATSLTMPGIGLPGASLPTVAAITPILAQYGLRVVGMVISGSKALWAKVPQLVKAAAAALGLTFLADSAAESLFGNGNGAPRRRRRGITATELRGFNKVGKLLRKVGMRPKVLGGGSRRVCRK